jgi:hypothetical protein
MSGWLARGCAIAMLMAAGPAASAYLMPVPKAATLSTIGKRVSNWL